MHLKKSITTCKNCLLMDKSPKLWESPRANFNLNFILTEKFNKLALGTLIQEKLNVIKELLKELIEGLTKEWVKPHKSH